MEPGTRIGHGSASRRRRAARGRRRVPGASPLIYFKRLEGVGAGQLVAHRILWTAILLVPLLIVLRAARKLRALLADRRRVLGLCVSAVLIGNWSIFIYAVLAGRVLEASLGYFINPLISLLLGMVFMGERMRPIQWLAVAIAAGGVLNEVMRFGDVPWLGLTLALSFGFYGLLRKRLAVDSFVGLTVESWVLLPVAVGYLARNAESASMPSTSNRGSPRPRGPGDDVPIALLRRRRESAAAVAARVLPVHRARTRARGDAVR